MAHDPQRVDRWGCLWPVRTARPGPDVRPSGSNRGPGPVDHERHAADPLLPEPGAIPAVGSGGAEHDPERAPDPELCIGDPGELPDPVLAECRGGGSHWWGWGRYPTPTHPAPAIPYGRGSVAAVSDRQPFRPVCTVPATRGWGTGQSRPGCRAHWTRLGSPGRRCGSDPL